MIELNERQFLLRRLHSLAGVLPIGVFLIEHLFGNSFAIRLWGSPEAYNNYVLFLLGMPYTKYIMEIVVLAIPIGFHAVYGLMITKDMTLDTRAYANYPFKRNVAFMLQRITGVILVVYIIVHVYRERFLGTITQWVAAVKAGAPTLAVMPVDVAKQFLPSATSDLMSPYQTMASHLSNPGYFIFSLVGVLAATFHFSNGLWSFGVTWGILTGPRSQRAAVLACGGIFLALSGMGILALASFR